MALAAIMGNASNISYAITELGKNLTNFHSYIIMNIKT